MFRVITQSAAERDRTRIPVVRVLPVRAFPAAANLVESCIHQVSNQLSNLSWHGPNLPPATGLASSLRGPSVILPNTRISVTRQADKIGNARLHGFRTSDNQGHLGLLAALTRLDETKMEERNMLGKPSEAELQRRIPTAKPANVLATSPPGTWSNRPCTGGGTSQ